MRIETHGKDLVRNMYVSEEMFSGYGLGCFAHHDRTQHKQ